MKKRAEFVRLFQEFVNSYLYTSAGLRHTAAYDEQRQQAHRNFEAIRRTTEAKEDITEAVLLQLLPHPDSANNRQKGAWIHHSVCTKFEQKVWTKPEDCLLIAKAVFHFVCQCNDDPQQLVAACSEFLELPFSKVFQMGMLTPILNALHSDQFLLINNKSIQVINYFANTSYIEKLTDYPTINITGHKLLKKLAQDLHKPGVPALRDNDLFDMFCHWLVVVKKYDLATQELQPKAIVIAADDQKEMEMQPEYTLAQSANETGIEAETWEFWLQAIARTKQAIFYGPPGTGKTYIAKKLAQHLIGGGDGFWELVQFHPVYAYEDFVQGIRPQLINGELNYSLVDGQFVEFCRQAGTRQHICILIIDEINRANIARVFGELMYLLEYRDAKIPLAAGKVFGIPANVRIIGTMNTADRSIALVDHALRRRFAFIPIYPNYKILRHYHRSTGFPVDKLIEILEQLNQEIGNPHYEVGISFFLRPQLKEQIESIWRLEIEPYLEEYFFNQPSKVKQFRWHKIKPQVCP